MNLLGVNQYPIRTVTSDPEARALARRERIRFKRKQYRRRTKAQRAAYGRRWREQNRERESARKRRWTAANRARINARNRTRYALNA